MGAKSKLRNARKLAKSKAVFFECLSDLDSSYIEYLQSNWWQEVRAKYLIGKKCCGCDQTATQLHHVTYVNLGMETSQDVMPLCGLCHTEVHARLDASQKSVEWTAWALRKMFGWTRKQVNSKLGLSYTGTHQSVMVGKV
jgi:hypothetical protein